MAKRPRKPPEPDPMTIAELAERWRVSKQTVQRMVNLEHRFPNAFRIGWQWRIPLADVQAYEAEQLRKRRR
jgi:excisionase family DNA binding protein